MRPVRRLAGSLRGVHAWARTTDRQVGWHGLEGEAALIRSLCILVLLATAALPAGAEELGQVSSGRDADRADHRGSDPLEPLALAWSAGGGRAEDHGARLVGVARRLGVEGLEPAAVALLLEPGAERSPTRTALAVELAPSLPAAHAAHARALTGERRLVDALVSSGRALGALRRHFDSRLWLDVAVLTMVTITLAAGGLLFLGVLGVLAAPRAAHDLGDLAVGVRQNARERTDMPGFARAALLASLLLFPLAVGEGALGIGLALFALSVVYGDGARRLAAACAVSVLLAAVFPLETLRQQVLARVAADAVPSTAYAAAQGVPVAQDLERLRHAAAERPMAALALSLTEMRQGRLADATARLAPHLEASRDPSLLNHAANLALLRGNDERAIELYQRATRLAASPEILFNLSQAYGQTIQLGEQDATLARAQALDAEVVTALMIGQEDLPRGVVDLPVETQALLAGLQAPPVPWLRGHPLAPGRLGSPWACLVLFLALGLLGMVLPRRFRRSTTCSRCGIRRCPRCDRPGGGDGLCGSCSRLTHSPETTDPGLRSARLEQLRRRQRRLGRLHTVASLVVPGSAGLLGGRPFLGLLGAIAFAGFATLGRAASWLPPDPGSVGGAAMLLLAIGSGAAGSVYLAGLVLGLRAQRGR